MVCRRPSRPVPVRVDQRAPKTICVSIFYMTRFRRLLLLLVMIALPLQSAMAASRLCVTWMPPAESSSIGASEHQMHMAATASDHHAMDPTQGAKPAMDHSDGTCKHCAACTVTAALGPPALMLLLDEAGFTSFRPIVVPVPHNVADGLERPPRTT